MPNPNYIQKNWESFSADLKLDKASPVQQREMRIAFFAGGFSLMRMMMTIFDDTGDPNDVTDFDMQAMRHITEEFDSFADAVGGDEN